MVKPCTSMWGEMFMNRQKNKRNREKARLADLLGVLLFLIENSEDDNEREFFNELAKETENKIKEIRL